MSEQTEKKSEINVEKYEQTGDVETENNNFTEKDSSRRERYVTNVKTEMVFFNFGLPSSPKYVNLGWDDVVPKIRALHELQVRLNVYLANGKQQSGTIDYPEADRVIEYNFDDECVDKSYVRFYSTRNDSPVKLKK